MTAAHMPKVLILTDVQQAARDRYKAVLLERFPHLSIDVVGHHEAAKPYLADMDVLMCFSPPMADHVVRDARKLRWIQALGTGVDNIIDLPSLGREVLVTNVRGIHGAPVSEAALATMLALARDLPGFVRAQDEHQWKRWPAKLLQGKTVGILGIGVIAEALAPKCKAMGMNVVGITSSPRKVAGFDRIHPIGELLTVLPSVDHFVLLTPYSAATHHMIDAKVFAAMKPTSFFINVARGGVVDEDALIEALRNKKIAGAALDVFNQEPLPPDNPLWDFKNVIITTHQGGFCDTYVDLAMPILERNMRCFLDGKLQDMANVARAAS